MTEQLQHFGYPCETPEPDIVGICHVCSGDIYDYELADVGCDCSPGDSIHQGCKIPCAGCGHEGCKKCMLRDEDSQEYFCGQECKNE